MNLPKESLAPLDLTSLRFLVVDDSLMIRDRIEFLLKKLGVSRIDKVVNGKYALLKIRQAIANKIPYDLVTLDWEMPEMNGLEVLKQLRSDPSTKDVLVLMVTARAERDDVMVAKEYEPAAYIVKPFTRQTFEAKIRFLYDKMR